MSPVLQHRIKVLFRSRGIPASLAEAATPAAARVVVTSGIVLPPFGGFRFGDGLDELAAESLLQGEASRGTPGAGAEILPPWQVWRQSIRRANSHAGVTDQSAAGRGGFAQ